MNSVSIQMTKKEYEKKYGVKPVFSATSILDITPAPVRMTRTEYNERYGIKETERKSIFTPAKEAITEFPEVYKQGVKDITSEVKQSAEDVGKMDFAKPGLEQLKIAGRLAKTGARVAGDVAGIIFAPIGAAIQATGFNKLTDYLANKIVESPIGQTITDMPAVQKFAVTHPNAEKDFNRALMLLMSKGEKGKIEPKTAIPRTVEQVKLVGEKTKELPAKIKEVRSSRATEKVSQEIANIENNYVQTRKANEFSKDLGAESRKRIAQTDVLVDAVDKDGLIRTKQPGGAVEQYRKLTLDGAEGIVRDNLIREGKKINIAEVAKELTTQVYRSGLEGADLIKAVNGLRNELDGLKLRADELGNIELAKIHDAKISTTNNINYKTDSTPTIKFRKAKARAYKTLVENKSDVRVDVDGRQYGIPEINKELGKYYEDIERLQMLDGKRVKGGKLGKYSAQIVGNVAGAAVGGMFGGLGGSAVGTIIGGETAGLLKGKSMASTFGEAKGRDVLSNAILEKAKADGKLPPTVNLKIPDVKVGTPSGIVKTKEIFKVERDIAKNVEQQKAAIRAGNFELVATLKEIYQVLVQHLKDLINEIRKNQEGFIRFGEENTSSKNKLGGQKEELSYKNDGIINKKSQDLAKEAKIIRGTKGLTADQIMQKYPDIVLKRDVPATDIYGKKVKIPEGEALTPYELKGNKVLLQDGETYIVSKNQFQNIRGNAISGEAKEFAPELKGTEETVKGASKWQGDELVDNGNTVANVVKNEDGTWSYMSDFSEGEQTFKTRKEAMKEAESATIGDVFNEELPTKYSQYQLPGGNNYKEVLIKAPKTEIRRVNGKTYDENGMSATDFKSSHWDEPNVISHLRLNERTYKGKKVTFMEELQSDWAREGRSKGFASDVDLKWEKQPSGDLVTKTKDGFNITITKEGSKFYMFGGKGNALGATYPTIEQAQKYAQNYVGAGIPDSPLLKNWQELSVKRALKEAVDNNSEYLAWTTGEQQAARYNLSTQLESIKWDKPTDLLQKSSKVKSVELKAIGRVRGEDMRITVDENGKVVETLRSAPSEWKGKQLGDVIGKGVAEKILAEPKGNLSGEGLNIGGEWAKNLYDKQVKNIVEDLTGHKVEVIDMGLPIAKGNEDLFRFRPNPANDAVDKVLGESDLKVGREIAKTGGDSYIITDVLGDGKFKAVPFDDLIDASIFKYTKPETIKKYPSIIHDGEKTYYETARQQTFDISTKKSAGQQAIKITPEIRAMVKGKSPKLKSASGRLYDTQ